MPVLPLPWFLPGVGLAIIVGVPLSGALVGPLGVNRRLALALVIVVGVILAATLTPLGPALSEGRMGSGRCDLTRLTPPRLDVLLAIDDVSLNVALFVPLGIALALLPPTRPRRLVIVAALLLPVAVEAVQLLLPVLARGCESADVVDNLCGLGLGFAIGRIGAWVTGRRRRGIGTIGRAGDRR